MKYLKQACPDHVWLHRLVTCSKMESAVVLHCLQMLYNVQLTDQLTSHLQGCKLRSVIAHNAQKSITVIQQVLSLSAERRLVRPR